MHGFKKKSAPIDITRQLVWFWVFTFNNNLKYDGKSSRTKSVELKLLRERWIMTITRDRQIFKGISY